MTKLRLRAAVGWVAYDFANSAFAVVVLAVIFNTYYTSVIAGGVEGSTFRLLGYELRIPGVTLYSFINVLALGLVALASPVIGALADFSGRKRRYLRYAWILGLVCTGLLTFMGAGDLLLASLLFIFASVGFGAGTVFYDAFLPEIAPPGQEGRLSGIGYAAGYLGGGLLLVIILLLAQHVPGFEYRYSFGMTAFWWLLFGLPTMILLRDTPTPQQAGSMGGYLKIGWRRVRTTLHHFRELPTLKRFLLANLVFGTGVETVIRLAAIFGAMELGMDQGQLVVFFLVIQFTALAGAMLFGYIADLLGKRWTLIAALGVWELVLVWAWYLGIFGDARMEFWLIGILAGVAMGGSQGVSRALQSVILPKGMENEFFGFFTMSSYGANILGMGTFGVITWITGELRIGIVSLLVFFVIGTVLLLTLKESRGHSEAKAYALLHQES